MNRQHERRRFLRAVGATALTLPFVKALPSYAATGDPPVYLVLLFTPSGFVQHLWGAVAPKPTGMTPSIVSPLQFRPTLSVFDTMGLTDKVTVLDGLNVGAADGTSHEPGMGALWTGVTTVGQATTPSIDQVIADQLNAGRPFKTIDLMVRSSQDWTSREVKTRMSYSATGAFVDPLDNPIAARNTLFPGAASMGTGGPDKKTFIRNKLFNQFNTELTGLQGKLCNEDRAQLQAMQQSWHDLNQQLASAATAAAACAIPGAPPAGYRPVSADSFPTSAKLQMDILAMALACDLTRVATLQFSTATSQVTHTWLGPNQTQVHHDYSHLGPNSMYALGTDIYSPAAASQYGALAQLSAIDAWYAQQVAYLASSLKMFSVGGKNLLDQTVICWGSEVALGAAHNHNAAPFVLIGGGGGRLKTNQVVRFPMRVAADQSTANIVDRAHNDLLVTLAQVMGVNMTTFGGAQFHQDNPTDNQPHAVSTGPIREILAT